MDETNEKTVLQDFAEGVGAVVAGVPKSEVSAGMEVRAVEWVILIQMIMAIVTQLMEQCQQNKQRLIASVKKPNDWQEVRFRHLVRNHCEDCVGWGWRRRARAVADAMIKSAASEEDTVLEQIVDQVRNSSW